MFEITPDPAFSDWFEGLSEPVAIEVTTALEVVAEAGAVLAPTRVRSLLLWYDGTSTGPPLDLVAFDAVRDLLLWQTEAVRCLESAAFVARLERLEPEAAVEVLLAVARLRTEIDATKKLVRLGSVAQARAMRGPMHVTTAREARVLEERFGVRPTEPSLVSGIEKSFFAVLGLAGLDPERVVNSESGLRELTLETSPRIRVLFGLDFEGKRLIALVGEALDRRYYGDSVRFAEQRFAHYLSTAARTADHR